MNLGTVGPDVVDLKPDQDYHIILDKQGARAGVCVTAQGGKAIWALSGKVVFAGSALAVVGGSCETMDKAREEDVAVRSQMAKAYPELRLAWVAIWSGIFLVLMVLIFLLQAGMEPHVGSGLPYWRGAWALVQVGAVKGGLDEGICFALTGIKLRAAGAIVTVTWAASVTVPCYAICLDLGGVRYSISRFIASFVMVLASVPAILVAQMRAWYRRRTRLIVPEGEWALKRQAAWALWTTAGTLGGWTAFYCVAVLFTFSAPKNPQASNLLLPITTAALESAIVVVTGKAYENTVNVARRAHKIIRGDQKMTFLFPIASAHSFAQAMKLCSLLTQGVREPGRLAWITSVAASFLGNLLARTDILRGPLVHVLPRCIAAKVVIPGAAKVLHSRVRIVMGYPIFIVPIAIVIARKIRGEEKALFSDMALVILATVFCVEVITDIIILKKWLPVNAGLLELENFYMKIPPDSAMQVMHFDCRGKATFCARDLRNLRHVGFVTTGGWMVGMIFFPLCLLELLLGVGYMFGMCAEPLDTNKLFENALVWTAPLRCE
mmetsp:Transcript_65304/g.204640  ORF Transcript_65304/g.204640 Transcript_65304/m.204640 type:complete len:550 (-) Transcript_65304:69-1718(-)